MRDAIFKLNKQQAARDVYCFFLPFVLTLHSKVLVAVIKCPADIQTRTIGMHAIFEIRNSWLLYFSIEY